MHGQQSQHSKPAGLQVIKTGVQALLHRSEAVNILYYVQLLDHESVVTSMTWNSYSLLYGFVRNSVVCKPGCHR